MSSGFISGGTIDQPNERDAEWLKAQEELEEVRRKKAEVGRQQDGKSLYEVLEQNKAAKQDAFEESIRLRNQFRALDDDEVDFLDAVLESTRAKEEAVKRETQEQLDLFRKQQDEADRLLRHEGAPTVDAATTTTTSESTTTEESSWAIGPRKRKRANEKHFIPGFKLRKPSLPSEFSTGHPDVRQDQPAMSPISKEANPTVKRGTTVNRASHALAPLSKKEMSMTEAQANPPSELCRSSGKSSALGLVSYDSGEES